MATCPSLESLGIELVVFDMAGTVVNEHGIVYTTLQEHLKLANIPCPEAEFEKWHGANKKEVVQHFVKVQNKVDTLDDAMQKKVDEVYAAFETALNAKYTDEASGITPIEGSVGYFDSLRQAGIKVGLDTGFPRAIADFLIKKLHFKKHIDASVVAMEVGAGRPYPYMVHQLMQTCGVMKASSVAKVGDTVRDIEEGLAAGCGAVYGVLTGADSRERLEEAGATWVFDSVTDIPIRTCRPYYGPSLVEAGIKLVVFDMAGTCVDEHGIVYTTLRDTLLKHNVPTPEDEFEAWHGANKKEVVDHFVQKLRGTPDCQAEVNTIYAAFESTLVAKYTDPNSTISLIPGTKEVFAALRTAGIKVALDTGFPRAIADFLIKKLKLGGKIDGSVVATEVGKGRPYPYMIFNLMRRFGIESCQHVAKVGDTVRDVEEGQAAGCGMVFGVLTGADKNDRLEEAEPTAVFQDINAIPIVTNPKAKSEPTPHFHICGTFSLGETPRKRRRVA